MIVRNTESIVHCFIRRYVYASTIRISYDSKELLPFLQHHAKIRCFFYLVFLRYGLFPIVHTYARHEMSAATV